MSRSIFCTLVPSVTGINYLPLLPMSRLSRNSGKNFQACLSSSCDPIERPNNHVHSLNRGSGTFYLFIRHNSFTQGNLQSEKITTLTVEEEDAIYFFTECVTKSCDSLDLLIQTCYQSASSRVTEMAFWTWPCAKCFQKCFSVESLIILSLNTVIPIIVIV